MTTTTLKYPSFDLLEVNIDRDLSYKSYQSLKPVKTGDTISRLAFDFSYSRWQNFLNGTTDDTFVATKQLYGQPIVISFYSRHWHGKGIEYLKQLNSLHKEVKANGGNLIVISAEDFTEDLAEMALSNNLSLTIYFDPKNEIAEQMGVYSENDPIWNWFAGIDSNAPLLSSFVVANENVIVFDHNYRDYDEVLLSRDLIKAVGDSTYISNLLLSA
ncbi:redoxin domain-containing protein [Mucilaginibacter calamicampi]|uniref:Redoxin domain-containing protein n=1 Tax=Mucilaginibacter calamicampi TaxID=1302352 RepID=A0ABW2YSZ8_9SPHI